MSSFSANQPDQNPPAVIHVDLDGAADIYKVWGLEFSWPNDSVFESGLRNFLDLCDQNSIRATLFLIANSLEHPRKAALVREALRRGHEIACHSLTHTHLLGLDRERKRQEIVTSRDMIQQILGIDVHGFRAPGYKIDRESIELLAEAGYSYDASVFPTETFAERLSTPVSCLLSPYRPVPGSAFIELPLPDHRPSPVPFSPSYALLFGTSYFHWGVRRHRRRGTPFVLLFHLIDLADPLPADQLRGWKSRLFTLSTMSGARKRAACQRMLDALRSEFRLTTTAVLLDEVEKQLALEPLRR